MEDEDTTCTQTLRSTEDDSKEQHQEKLIETIEDAPEQASTEVTSDGQTLGDETVKEGCEEETIIQTKIDVIAVIDTPSQVTPDVESEDKRDKKVPYSEPPCDTQAPTLYDNSDVSPQVSSLNEMAEETSNQALSDVFKFQGQSPVPNYQKKFEVEQTDTMLLHEERDTGTSNIKQGIFVCSCSEIDRISPAVFSCSTCLEFYCNECADDHKSFKTTRSHVLKKHNALFEQNTCEPCAHKGLSDKRPTHLCIECDEALCEECKTRHQRQKMARNHVLVPCTAVSKPDVKCSDVDTAMEKNTDIETRMQPGKPFVGKIDVDRVTLVWDPPKELFPDHNYQLRYKQCNTQMKWTFYSETLGNPSATLHNLKSGAQFVFQVRMVDDEHEGPYSELSEPIETIQSAAAHLFEFMTNVQNPSVGMPLKRLPLQENKNARNDVGKTRKLYLGEDKGISTKERTILLVGSTGTGKSTLVDGMINYILGVKWSDPYRLTLVDLEDNEKNKNQALSQTEWITCYIINPSSGGRLDYRLNIIDTPGFGDTRGIDRDKEIVQQIKHLFSREDDAGVLSIDAVCFIVKAPDARLTPTQKYIFESIMSLFGQDIKDNFSMLITFADGKQPPVLAGLREADLPHADDEYFPFNNSGLFADNSSSNESNIASLFWNMGCESFEHFFTRLAKMQTKSLIQTRDVLIQREKIELTMENLMKLVDAGLSKIEETRLEIDILIRFKTQIEENKDFKYTVTETQQKQIDLPLGQHTTNCLSCNFTCHESCAFSDDDEKARCCAMRNGYCTECPGKCFWKSHKNTRYIFEYVSVTKERTYAEKLDKYRHASDETMTREKVVERMHEEMCDLENEILLLMDKINECNNILRRIALRPDPLSLVEHIDLLIKSEEQGKRAGFQSRIASLKECRRRANIGDEIDRLSVGFETTTKQISATVKLTTKSKTKGISSYISKFFGK